SRRGYTFSYFDRGDYPRPCGATLVLRRADRRRDRQQREQRIGIARAAQFTRDLGVAQQARHPRERLEMIGAGGFRRQEQENEIDRLTIERLEIDGALQPRE